MNRSKREIKTPKRFDDEPFETPRARQSSSFKQLATKQTPEKEQLSQEPQMQLQPKLSKITPAKSQSNKTSSETKGIIKVKLSRTKQTPTITQLDLSSISSSPSTPPTPSPAKEPPLPPPTTPQLIKQNAQPKQPAQPRQSTQPKQQVAPKQVTPKSHSLAPPKTPKALTRPPELPEIINVPRPKRERPRTPPAYADVIPNVVLPFWDARTAAEDHEDDNVKELVHCQCGIIEELGLMVQCETCLTWQHANCLGVEQAEDVPDGYTCQACSDPRFARESRRWAYDQEWIVKGRMKQFSCDVNPIPEEKIKLLQTINQLIADTLRLQQLINSLQAKSQIYNNAKDDDPDLRLFKIQWLPSYQHRDGTHFVPTINQLPGTPASTISVIGETPEPCDIPVESVADVSLPDIGQLGDVSAILDNTDIGTNSIQPIVSNHESTPNDCRANLKLHIQQTEEFIGIELAQIEQLFEQVNKECSLENDDKSFKVSFESLKNDLYSMRRYLGLERSNKD